MNIKGLLKRASHKLAALLTRKKPSAGWLGFNLHPTVEAAFIAALEPVERRATPSKLGSTSRGRSWFPRNRYYPPRVTVVPAKLQLPKKSPFMLRVEHTDRVYLQRHDTLYRADKLAAA